MKLEQVNGLGAEPERMHLEPVLASPQQQDERWAGKFSEPSSSRTVIPAGQPVVAYKPDGTLLATVVRQQLSKDAMASAFSVLRKYSTRTDLRGKASGFEMQHDTKKDGTISNTSRVNRKLHQLPISGVMGYFDRYVRIPYCRKCTYNRDNPQEFAKTVPLYQEMDRVYRATLPERHAGQLAAIEATHPDWRIADTVFTTITVNRNWRTAFHRDAGDLIAPGQGVSCLAAMWGGDATGGNLVLPAWDLEVELRSGDMIMMDSHEIHGNTPIVGIPGKYHRVSVVAYYRTAMQECGSSDEEFARAKAINTERAERRRRGEL
jgi:hypothetical protein